MASVDKVMPDEKLIPFTKERLGGLINSAIKFIPDDKGQELKKAFQTELKDFLGLKDGLSVAFVNKDIRTLKGIFNLAIEPRGYPAEDTDEEPKECWYDWEARPPIDEVVDDSEE